MEKIRLKSICILLAAIFVGGLFGLPSSALASSEPEIKAESVSTLAGETVEYTVSLSGNPGIAAFLIELSFDKAKFNLLKDAETGAPVCKSGNVTAQGNLICTETEYGCKVLWYNTVNAYDNGALFTVALAAASSAPVGDYNVRLSYSKANTVNINEDKINLNCVDGMVTIREYEPKFIGQVLTSTNSKIEYGVSVQDNPGMAGFLIELNYDQSIFEIESSNGEVMATSGPAINTGNIAAREENGKVSVLWSSARNVYGDGLLFTVTMRRKENTPVGIYPIYLSYDASNTMDEHTRPVSFSCVDGSIKLVTNNTSSVVSYVTGASNWNIPAQEKFFGQNLILTSERPQKSGYSFAGWATKPNAIVPEYAPGTIYSVDADIVLYAVWHKIENGIFEVAVLPNSANITVSCSGEADLVIAAYDDKGKMLHMEARAMEDAYYDNVYITLDLSETSGYIKVLLLESDTHAPLCEAYETSF